jgi:hypothetical protein
VEKPTPLGASQDVSWSGGLHSTVGLGGAQSGQAPLRGVHDRGPGVSELWRPGGDWGTSVTNYLEFAYPQHLIGIHTTSMTRPTPYLGLGSRTLSAAEQAFLDQRESWLQAGEGYSHIQGTKPQTLAYGLNDSPAGLAA